MTSKFPKWLQWVAALLALGLLCATMAWHFPLMLWDHLDFVPIYTGWKNGTLAQTGFLHIHGGHLHTAAYVLLLATTSLSHGKMWMDCLASWLLLAGYALLILRISKRTLPVDQDETRFALALIVFMAFYPGHLPNLQWGWQVAVFLCLGGAATAIACLTAPQITWKSNLVALAATGIALLSFACGLAVVPIVLMAIVLRRDVSLAKRLEYLAPWLLICIAALYIGRNTANVLSHFSAQSLERAWTKFQLLTISHYALNYLGSGVSRWVPALAPWLAALAIATGIASLVRTKGRYAVWPWAAFMLFGIGSAVLTALARFDEGESQAFVGRYVSFSSVFWIGWIGLFFLSGHENSRPRFVWSRSWLWVIAAFASMNAFTMMREGAQIGFETHELAQTLCKTYPKVDETVLAGMYYRGAQAAHDALDALYQFGFAPFDACGKNASAAIPVKPAEAE